MNLVALVDRVAPLGGETLLDIGGGYGLLSIIFDLKGARVVSLDMDRHEQDQLETIIKNTDLGDLSIEIKHANTLSLPFDNSVFDLAFTNEVISHASDPVAFLAEAKRVLKKEGTLIISDTNKETWLANRFQTKAKYNRLQSHFVIPTGNLVMNYISSKKYDIGMDVVVKLTYSLNDLDFICTNKARFRYVESVRFR